MHTVGLVLWAGAPKRLVIDDRAIAPERVVSRRVIALARVSSAQIVLKSVRGQTFRVATLSLRSGEEVVLPTPDGGIDDVYIAISSRLPGRPVDRPQARRVP